MSFLLAIATSLIMTIMPLLVTESLGFSMFFLGIVEGSTELLSNVLRLVSGNLFDKIKNKKLLFISPPLLAFLSKILLLNPSAFILLISKTIERIANGLFAVPRDSYIGAVAKNKGMAFGILSSFKSLGCVLGPSLVSGIVLLSNNLQENIYCIVLLACSVNFVAFLLSYFVNTKHRVILAKKSEKFNYVTLKPIFKQLRFIFIITILFFLGRFNDGLIMLYLKKQGFPEWFYLSTIALFNFVMFIIAPIIGILIDIKRYNTILYCTIISLLSFNFLFYNLAWMPWVFACLGLICWGIQRTGAHIIFTNIIFNKTPTSYYGTTIGTYSLLNGLGTFIASMISGYLAEISFSYVFAFSGFFSFLALLLVITTIHIRSDVA